MHQLDWRNAWHSQSKQYIYIPSETEKSKGLLAKSARARTFSALYNMIALSPQYRFIKLPLNAIALAHLSALRASANPATRPFNREKHLAHPRNFNRARSLARDRSALTRKKKVARVSAAETEVYTLYVPCIELPPLQSKMRCTTTVRAPRSKKAPAGTWERETRTWESEPPPRMYLYTYICAYKHPTIHAKSRTIPRAEQRRTDIARG